MSTEAQIQAIFKKKEGEEEELLVQRKQLLRIVETRSKDFEEIQRLYQQKQQRITSLGNEERTDALRDKNLARVSSTVAFISRLRRELRQLDPVLQEKQEELERANVRAQALESELRRVQMEKKQIERLLERRTQQGRILEEAQEEASLDELRPTRRQ